VIARARHKRVRHRPSRRQLWTRRVRARILANLRHHPILFGIVAALLLPGGVVLVPVIAWWHRRKRAAKPASRRRTADAAPLRAIMPGDNHRGQP
jgi:hypothetical protein